MSNFFNPDNKFFSFMSKVFDVVALNVIWLAMFIPFLGLLYLTGITQMWFLIVPTVLSLIVVVPSFIALYYSLVKAVRHQRSYPIKEFFHSFKDNFKQGAVASIIFMIIAAFLAFDFLYLVGTIIPEDSEITSAFEYVQKNGFVVSLLDVMSGGTSTKASLLMGAYIAITVFALGMMIFFCPILSRFEMKLGNAFKFSFGASIRHIGTTLLCIILWLLLAFFVWLTNGFVIIFGVSCTMLIESYLMEKVLKRYVLQVLGENKPEGEEQDDEELKTEGEIADKSDDGKEEKPDTKGHEDESRDEWYVE